MKITVTGIEGLEQEAEYLKTKAQKTYLAVSIEASKMYKEIGGLMPELTGNLKNNLVIEEDSANMRVKIILKDMPSFYNKSPDNYGTSKYFGKWATNQKMHKSVGEHSAPEKSRTKRLGKTVKANPKAVAMPFEKVLRRHGFTNIHLKITGNNKAVIEATPPMNWPFMET